jgi:LPXTG-site transpeptidase (sortase) family protein
MRLPRARCAGARRHHGSRLVRVIALTAFVALGGASGVGITATEAKAPSSYYVEATGHALGEPFLSHWADHDGLTTLGLPVSEPLTEGGRPTQYFELGYVQASSKSKHARHLVTKPVGRDLLDELRTPERTVAGRRVGGDRSAPAFRPIDPTGAEPSDRYVAETGHLLSGRIASFYDENGGVDRFGQPLSESYVAFGWRVQWFEFGRLQWSPSDGRVAAAPVGFELASARGVPTRPVDRGSTATFDPRRFRSYHGDGTIPNATGSFTPVHITIPSIRIDAAIEQVGITNGVMDVPKDAWNVGWYPDIAKPGDRTNVVMAGHKDWWGIGPTVFWNLGNLAPGDKIYVTGRDGQGFTYVVAENWDVDANTDANVIIGDTGEEALTLITCGGAFDGQEYLSRQIVRADRV